MIRFSRLSMLGTLLLGLSLGQSALARNECDRACLETTLDTYMQAVAANNPAAAPLTSIYRHTENDQVQVLGEGIWSSARGLGAVQRHYMDEITQNAVFYGIVEEAAELAIVAVRIHVENRQISEAEWFVGREGDPGSDGVDGNTLWDTDYLTNGNPPLIRTVPN